MAKENSKILTAEQEAKLRRPIEDYVGDIQAKIDSLRADGTEKVLSLQNNIDTVKRDKILSKQERESKISEYKAELEKAKSVEEKNKKEVSKLISEAEGFINAHFEKDYYEKVKVSCQAEREEAKLRYQARVSALKKEHEASLAKLSDHQEIKDEKYVHKNSMRRNLPRLKTEGTGLIPLNSTSLICSACQSLLLQRHRLKSGKIINILLTADPSFCRTVCTLQLF